MPVGHLSPFDSWLLIRGIRIFALAIQAALQHCVAGCGMAATASAVNSAYPG